jgi:hypothetical protein
MWRPLDSRPIESPAAARQFSPQESRTIMRKAMIVKLFVGSLVGFVGAAVLFLVAGSLALWSDSFVMDGPDVVGIRPDPFGWVMIGLAALALVLMFLASAGLFVAWVGAVVNTASLPDKAWFAVLVVGGLLSLGFAVTLAYVIAGPDGQSPAIRRPDAAPLDNQPPPPPPASAGTGQGAELIRH